VGHGGGAWCGVAAPGYTEHVDNRADQSYRLVVTGPERDLLYDHFRHLFWGRDGVEVVKDRRSGERRREAASVGFDRRTRERRHARPAWIVPPD
jgi:hypothetical protein